MCHHRMIGTRTLDLNVIQSTNVTIVRIYIGIGGKFGGLMNTRAPLMDGRIQLGFLVSMMPVVLMSHVLRWPLMRP
jgi:hypothetical protein